MLVLALVGRDLLRRVGGKFVHILWDAETHRIALQPLMKADSRAFKLSSKSGRRGMVISATAFLRHIRWDLPKTATVEVALNEENKLLEASLPSKFIGR